MAELYGRVYPTFAHLSLNYFGNFVTLGLPYRGTSQVFIFFDGDTILLISVFLECFRT